VAVRRIGRCLSVDDEGGKTELLDSLNLERVAVQWNGMAVDAAVPMLQNFEDGKAGSEILIHGIAAVHLMWTTFSQHQQACGVVDLAVHEDDGCNAGVANGARGLQRGEGGKLGKNVRRCIEKYPVHAIGADCYGRLGPGSGFDGAFAQAVAIGTVAIPLRKTAAGGGAQYMNKHFSLLAQARPDKTGALKSKNASTLHRVWRFGGALVSALRSIRSALLKIHGNFKAQADFGV